MNGTRDLTAIAVRLLEKKFKLLPVHNPTGDGCSCGEVGCDRIGKHPRLNHWPTKASADPRQIGRWYATWQETNIGVAAGAESGIWVLDVDFRHGGGESLRALEEKHSPLPPTLTATTGNGFHSYFRHPGFKVTGRNIASGLDVRGDGNQVVCPPSHHANGKIYEWQDESAPIAEAPGWLLALLTGPSGDIPLVQNQEIPEGQRNDAIYKVVCDAFRKGTDKDDVLRLALQTNERRCRPPLPEAEIADIVLRVEKTNRPLLDITKRKSLSWFQFNAAEFLANQSIRSLTDAQVGWRTRLNAVAWLNGGRLEHNTSSLMDYAKPTSRKVFREQWRLALFDFVEVEEYGEHFLVNREMAAHHTEKVQKSIMNQRAGHVGGTAKGQLKEAA